MPTVYVETSVVSYLTAWRSPQTTMAGQQEQTREWWDQERHRFELFTSEVVVREASAGDSDASARRLAVIDGLPLLDVTDEATELADELLLTVPLPAKAAEDALHIAVACINGIDYLLTWNCRHLANAMLRPHIDRICRAVGYEPPIICTPPELTEVHSDDA